MILRKIELLLMFLECKIYLIVWVNPTHCIVFIYENYPTIEEFNNWHMGGILCKIKP